MLTMRTMIALGFLVAGAAVPARASCDDELKGLDKRVEAEGQKAIASSSSGQGQSAAREGQAKEARDDHAPVKDLPQGPAAGSSEAHATTAAAEAGGGGDRVIEAKATINDARVAKGKGDEAGCLAAVGKAKQQLAR